LDGLSSRIAQIRLQNSWRFMLGQKNILLALEAMNLELLKASFTQIFYRFFFVKLFFYPIPLSVFFWKRAFVR
jgi:hypothetical protein